MNFVMERFIQLRVHMLPYMVLLEPYTVRDQAVLQFLIYVIDFH